MGIDSIRLDFFAINKDILVVRDDVFPFYMGGNKARKMVSIINDIEKNNCNAIVTTGGIQSNHCRVVALVCAKKGWECILVLHGSRQEFLSQKGNALIMRLTNARIRFAQPSEIGYVMDKSMDDLKNEGLNPYYLSGGGHNKAGVTAYVKAVQELRSNLPYGQVIDHIFLASGTGSTQAGIHAGCREIGWDNTIVHGISVARHKSKGINSILESLVFINKDPDDYLRDICFYDDFLFGGYGRSGPELKEFIILAARKTGMLFDEVYSGKAFFGMISIIKKENLKGNILFWHTGGLLNLMA